LRRVAPRRAQRLDERRLEQLVEAPRRRLALRHAGERLHRRVPPHYPIVQVEHEQAVIERLDDVLVEGAHAIELERLDVQLTVEPGVFHRRRYLSRNGGEKAHVFAVQRLARVLAPDGEDGDCAFLRHTRHKVVQAGVAPILDFLHLEPRRSDRIVERDGMAVS
jgi:hypothetical protein